MKFTDELTLVSFDNHPDWDIRPPRWGCGGWVNRALEMPGVVGAHVWGCGNFELAMPSRMFGSRKENLVAHPWEERMTPAARKRYPCMNRQNWKDQFERFAATVSGKNLYVTVDMDCLCEEEARSNWENGLFTAEDVAWAIGRLKQSAKLIGGDVCGAFSPLAASGIFRRFAMWWDHPKVPAISMEEARRTNTASLAKLWPVLAG